MAKQRTEKSPFESAYSEGYVTFTQWLTELICVRKATAEGRRLSPRFWLDKEWGRHFKTQMTALRTVMKQVGAAATSRPDLVEKAIITVFNHREYSWVLSFRTPKFAKAVRAELFQLINLATAEAAVVVERETIPEVQNKAEPCSALTASKVKTRRAVFAALDNDD